MKSEVDIRDTPARLLTSDDTYPVAEVAEAPFGRDLTGVIEDDDGDVVRGLLEDAFYAFLQVRWTVMRRDNDRDASSTRSGQFTSRDRL